MQHFYFWNGVWTFLQHIADTGESNWLHVRLPSLIIICRKAVLHEDVDLPAKE